MSTSAIARQVQVNNDTVSRWRRRWIGLQAATPHRAAFLSDTSHPIVFHYTCKHSSWLNHIELWLSILVRKLLKRASFSSVADLQAQVLAFIASYNRTMAHHFAWTYTGNALPT